MIRALSFLLLIAACSPSIDELSSLGSFPFEISKLLTLSESPARDTAVLDPLGETSADRFQPPSGFQRVTYPAGTFGHYLQHFPLQAHGRAVYLFDGRLKNRQDVHAAVLDIDVGKRDLQQCADAVMRLRAEYLWQGKRFDAIHFNFTNGFAAPYSRWRSGERIRVTGNEVSWVRSSRNSETYASFRSYLTMIFAFSGTLSLSRDLKPKPLREIEAGDVFIEGGSPGHAVLVMDKAVHPETGEILVLLAQSYMPAQDIHILRNFRDDAMSPWYSLEDFSDKVRTPEWHFSPSDLKAF
ncbi:DUF4846 domain-containing protein [Flavilitoribacter nigricans]|uniref:DUF4846 domain-containing protein n=1 Tax=Flavilitoribacter nigricans (strain ATCC 23147 / DSM 23189 / NBRC 102662 / NCIMB 1420 / SS-2) TaxID=1122177 RepID=A0A2D0NAR6_FLAN2|nr:DUF4846 domain-containing protein [Flavilitoribacter nigricans]PHN05604.1 hypothetical protein CRP01_16585 [Flavilitoribacter nigricans DSM 23189 = NBRC 102662]